MKLLDPSPEPLAPEPVAAGGSIFNFQNYTGKRWLWLLRQALLVLTIALLVNLSFLLFSGASWAQYRATFRSEFVYTLLISAACSSIIQGLTHLATMLSNRLRARSGKPAKKWIGWPLMVSVLLLGTLAGFSIGMEVGNWLLGNNYKNPLSAGPRSGTVMLLIALVPGILITIYFVARGHLDEANLRAQTAQRLAAENKLRLLESQLEPHMLFNTLANLRVLIGLDPARAQAMLDQLIGFLRATLNASRSGSHPLREEFARLRDYLALMQIRMGSRLRPVLDLPAELGDLAVAPLLLQPLVENAIKHGLEPAIEGGELRISARREGQVLLLVVQDSGVGLAHAASASSSAQGTQFGLHQVRERLATQYGAAASLTITPAAESGTVVTLQIPIQAP
ncbi:sensor histidine kinase [Roseateles oligotrophus]|uniref:Histidine kinase n=1 Tax=Roseateles oligotrophus TaxID=1769250 RepID=A0ABT2YC03_9BURK|nr:histidine kinase [Roseateles oligotrophus]MCV2367340.1 histidine kinase [Roseateles oligotrophus]